jgi:Helix-turn-helix domain
MLDGIVEVLFSFNAIRSPPGRQQENAPTTGMVEAGVEIEIGSGKSNLVDFDLRFKTKKLEKNEVSALAAFYGPDQKSHAPPKPSPKDETALPPPRRATGIREWESWRYRDVLIEGLSSGDLTLRDFATGVILASFANRKGGGRCFPSIRSIAEKSGLKVDDRGQCRVVSESLANLKNCGAIETEDRRWNQPNGYLLIGGHVESGTPPHVESGTPDNIVKPTWPKTMPGEGNQAGIKISVLDDDMKAIATRVGVPEFDQQRWFDRWREINSGRRIRNLKGAWTEWCRTYKPDARDQFEGAPTWTKELWSIASKTGKFADEREAQKLFGKAIKRKKGKPIAYVVNWWAGVCRYYEPEEE